jgi:hypothetical protein
MVLALPLLNRAGGDCAAGLDRLERDNGFAAVLRGAGDPGIQSERSNEAAGAGHGLVCKRMQALRLHLLARPSRVVIRMLPNAQIGGTVRSDAGTGAGAVANGPRIRGGEQYRRERGRSPQLSESDKTVGVQAVTAYVAGEVGPLRSMYIDLLMKSILGMIHKASDENENRRRIDGTGMPSHTHSLIGWKRLANLRELVESTIKNDIPGDLIETGVWKGGACILMRGILAAYGITDRFVYLADSFQGVPMPNIEEFPADAKMVNWYQNFSISIDQVKENFEVYGLLDSQVVFVEGWFKDTLQRLSGSRFSLLRLDGDLYESTIEALDALYPLLSPGGFVIIDDYGAFEACRRAVEDYRSKNYVTAPLQKVDWTGVWWRKPKV